MLLPQYSNKVKSIFSFRTMFCVS